MTSKKQSWLDEAEEERFILDKIKSLQRQLDRAQEAYIHFKERQLSND